MIRGRLTVTVSKPALVGLGNPTGPIGRRWLQALARIDAKAKQKLSNNVVNVRTGNLRSSQSLPFVTIIGGKIVGTVQNIAKYALAVHNGSRPHEIRPARASVLTGWVWSGAPVFTPLAHHPGTKPRPWLLESLKEVITQPI